MTHTTNGANQRKVAILVANHFEDQEFNIPYTALQQAKANITIVGSRMNDEYHGKRGEITIKPDATATEVRAEDFDAIVIPGGGSPDVLRTNDHMVRLVIASAIYRAGVRNGVTGSAPGSDRHQRAELPSRGTTAPSVWGANHLASSG
jgi:hypothetical protein